MNIFVNVAILQEDKHKVIFQDVNFCLDVQQNYVVNM